jgi:hypothetical protein
VAPVFAQGVQYSLAGQARMPVSMQYSSEALSYYYLTQAAEEEALRTPESYHKHPFWMTILDIIVVNEVIWLFNRYIREGGENPEFRKSWDSFVDNLKNGFEWDDNNFSTNHFLHPYHGSLYMTGARSNGNNFWESIPYAFVGSWWWEYFGEVNNPSINDWINTAVGGVALGEALHRLAIMVTDNTATGGERAWRELAGFLVAPVQGFNRMITGEAFDVHANPGDRFPEHSHINWQMGLRWQGDERLWSGSSTKAFLRIDAVHGDPFMISLRKPFEHFRFRIQINFDEPARPIGRIETIGNLYGADVAEGANTQNILGAYQHFDYFDNPAFTYGQQAVGASYLTRIMTPADVEARVELHGNLIIMGASKSDYYNVSGRDYDYGPGVGYKFRMSFGRGYDEVLELRHDGSFIESMNGNSARHYVSVSQLNLFLPIREWFKFKGSYTLFQRDARYDDFPDVYVRSPELRLAVMWDID